MVYIYRLHNYLDRLSNAYLTLLKLWRIRTQQKNWLRLQESTRRPKLIAILPQKFTAQRYGNRLTAFHRQRFCCAQTDSALSFGRLFRFIFQPHSILSTAELLPVIEHSLFKKKEKKKYAFPQNSNACRPSIHPQKPNTEERSFNVWVCSTGYITIIIRSVIYLIRIVIMVLW